MEKEKARLIDGQANPDLILPKNYKQLILERKQKEREEEFKDAVAFIFELFLRILIFCIGYTLAHYFLLSLQV